MGENRQSRGEKTERGGERKKFLGIAIGRKIERLSKAGGRGYGARRERADVERAVETIYVESLCGDDTTRKACHPADNLLQKVTGSQSDRRHMPRALTQSSAPQRLLSSVGQCDSA